MKILTMLKLLKTPKKLILPLGKNQLLNWLPDSIYLKIVYFCEMNHPLNLNKPKMYSEKIQWIKINDRKSHYTHMVDKYLVRDYVSNKIGNQYLIPLYGVYTKVDDIEWDAFPEQFVIKCTHSSHTNIICTAKSNLLIQKASNQLKKWMKSNLFWLGREWAYKEVLPRIICEKYLSDTNMTPDDYKIICFNGKAKLIEVHTDRFGDHTLAYYDTQWTPKDYTVTMKSSLTIKQKPTQLEEMIQLSEKLISDTYISRVDWYIVKEKLYFGEITLYEASGFIKKESNSINRLFGDMCTLPTDIE